MFPDIPAYCGSIINAMTLNPPYIKNNQQMMLSLSLLLNLGYFYLAS
jgi:hypothetical protein